MCKGLKKQEKNRFQKRRTKKKIRESGQNSTHLHNMLNFIASSNEDMIEELNTIKLRE